MALVDGAGHRVDHGLAATEQGRRRLGDERHHPASGGALGVAVLGSVLASGFTAELARRLSELSVSAEGVARSKQSIGAAINYADQLGGKAGATLATVARESWMHGASLSLFIGSGFVFAGAALAFALLPARATHHHLNATELLPVPMVIDDDELDALDRGFGRVRRAPYLRVQPASLRSLQVGHTG